MIQRNLMISGIRWFQVFDDLKEISIGRMDFDNPKVYGDTSISDGLVWVSKKLDELNCLNYFVCEDFDFELEPI